MENTKNCQNNEFKANNISLKVQERQTIQQHNNDFRLYFDTSKKLRKCITNMVNPNTPYRCSLSQQNGLAATRGKVFMEPTFSARKRLKAKAIEKENNKENVSEVKLKQPNSVVVLPRILQGPLPLVSIPVSSKENKIKASKVGHFEGIPEFVRTRNAREHWENKTRVLKRQKSDLMASQRSYEDVMRLRERHLLSCNLVKSNPRGQLTLPHLTLKTATQSFKKYFEYRKAGQDNFEESVTSASEDEQDKVVLSNFSRTLNDGSKIIGSNHKLSIEVFMPKI